MKLLHGGDYFPEQWLTRPETIEEDFKYFKEANINTVTVGMFAWSILEPEENHFDFTWLDQVFDKAEENGMKVILGTPSGARPNWLASKYPDVLRVNERLEKNRFGGRHNHCFTSENYRERVRIVNEKLAERYGHRENLLMWHLSNEYSGECHCDQCQSAFRLWMQNKYGTLEAVNQAYWNTFWSHTYSDWSHIHSPNQLGEMAVHALNLDWRRFVTDQTIDFYLHEKAAINKYSLDRPVTTNFMADTEHLIPFQALDYSKFGQIVDIITWDCYPAWHNDWETEADLALKVGFINDLYRGLKEMPFLIMESSPSFVNWHDINRPKRPGMHKLASTQLLAHGSDSVLYFQMRASKGSSEKFHGSVIGHVPPERNRVYQEVASLGERMSQLDGLVGSMKQSDVAIYYDWENDWAIKDIQGFSKTNMNYHHTLHDHYRPFWRQDVNVDVITKNNDFDGYKLLVMPMMYLHSRDLLAKVQAYVEAGGTVVYTYMSGMANETDLVYDGGTIPGLEDMLGIVISETDVYYPSQRNQVKFQDASYEVHDYATVFETTSAETLAIYGSDFYQGQAAVSVNHYGKGQAYFMGARTSDDFLSKFYGELLDQLTIVGNSVTKSSDSVSVQTREDSEGTRYYFVMNFSDQVQTVEVPQGLVDVSTDLPVEATLTLQGFEAVVLTSK